MTYWDERAGTNTPANTVTLNDHNQRELELKFISKWLNPTDFVVESGCGNGYSTRTFSKLAKRVLAFDFSKSMIERAIIENQDLNNVSFTTGDVKNIMLNDNTADVVISQRCLINLMTFTEQKAAINEMRRILSPGGTLVLVEGVDISGLNEIRTKMGLPEIKVVSHNHNFDRREIIRYIMGKFEIQQIKTFGMYDFITRVIHPLMVYPDEPSYNAKINEIAKRIETDLIDNDALMSRCCIHELSKFSRVLGIAAVKR